MRKEVNRIIHESGNADFDNFVYTKVYAGAAATPTINGTAVTMAAGTSIEIVLGNISNTANVYVIGYPAHLAQSILK